MEQKYKYEINGKTYVQKKLVLGQLNQLTDILKYFKFPENVMDSNIGIALALGNRLPEALAIVLIEEGKTAKQMAEAETRTITIAAIEEHVEIEQAVEIIRDFFVCNPIASISQKIKAIKGMLAGIKNEMKKNGSTNCSPSSAGETSSGATESSGGSPSTNAGLS